MTFTRQLVNRLTMPTRHILVVEDSLDCQERMARQLTKLFGPQSHVQVSFVPGAEFAAAMLEKGLHADLIFLDHDMPYGSGSEFLTWMKEKGLLDKTKVITFSGIRQNNERMLALGAHVYFMKHEVLDGMYNTEELIRDWVK